MYKIGKRQKELIAQNLIDIVEKGSAILDDTGRFVVQWVYKKNTSKQMFVVWDNVLKNYLPKERPLLFRIAYMRLADNKIASFTSRWDAIKEFHSNNIRINRRIIIFDTTDSYLDFKWKRQSKGEYTMTYFPLVRVVEAINKKGGGLSDYIGEAEYITRISLGDMTVLKWDKEK